MAALRITLFASFSTREEIPRSSHHAKASNSRKSTEVKVKKAMRFAFSILAEVANYATTSNRLLWNDVALSQTWATDGIRKSYCI
jgi:hypothetical protein